MRADITRPEKCPHFSAGFCHNLCTHPAAGTHLYCDTTSSARGADGFPIDCPLRGEAE